MLWGFYVWLSDFMLCDLGGGLQLFFKGWDSSCVVSDHCCTGICLSVMYLAGGAVCSEYPQYCVTVGTEWSIWFVKNSRNIDNTRAEEYGHLGICFWCTIWPWRWMQYVPLEYQASYKVYSVTVQTPILFIVTVMRTANQTIIGLFKCNYLYEKCSYLSNTTVENTSTSTLQVWKEFRPIYFTVPCEHSRW
jgi:hypothetical protein